MVKEYPILFSGEMVRAILDGRKTQTRRVMKPQPKRDGKYLLWSPHEHFHFDGREEQLSWGVSDACPYGQPGDWLVPSILIEGYDCRYCADVYGRIWSKSTGEWKILKSNDTDGYMRLTLRKGGKDVNRTVHKLVCEAFYGPCPYSKGAVRHLNNNSHDNAPENLDWGTYSRNWDDRKSARNGINEQHHAAKLSMSIASKMRMSGKTAWALSKEYGVAPKTVQRVLNGQTWRESYKKPVANFPRWASRLTLEITNVKVERLNDISEEDAKAEGADHKIANFRPVHENGYREGFRQLWLSINGPGSWEKNPWVWVIEFKKV